MTGLALCLALCLTPAPIAAIADDAGVLSETELNAWLSKALIRSAGETPMNAPIGEEALTEDGYAFIYSFATFYYDKPILDDQSVLRAVALTDDAYASPRGLKVGGDAAGLISSFGWQNPMLLGDGSFAAFYKLDSLPEAAYWSWARQEGGKLLSVQCAIHVRLPNGLYTDAGILYAIENNVITAVTIYGLNHGVTEADVRGNLNAVTAVQAAITGDSVEEAPAAVGYTVKNEAEPFQAEDLAFSGVTYPALNEADAVPLFGKALKEDRVKDDTGAWLLTTQREGLTLSYTLHEDGSSTLDTLSVSGQLEGPRGVRVGMTVEEALKLFYSDGAGTVLGGASVLYGDGDSAPTGLMERDESGGTVLRYRTATEAGSVITLHLSFENDHLKEWMVYSW